MADRERISFSLSSNSNTGTTPHPHRSKPARVFGNYETPQQQPPSMDKKKDHLADFGGRPLSPPLLGGGGGGTGGNQRYNRQPQPSNSSSGRASYISTSSSAYDGNLSGGGGNSDYPASSSYSSSSSSRYPDSRDTPSSSSWRNNNSNMMRDRGDDRWTNNSTPSGTSNRDSRGRDRDDGNIRGFDRGGDGFYSRSRGSLTDKYERDSRPWRDDYDNNRRDYRAADDRSSNNNSNRYGGDRMGRGIDRDYRDRDSRGGGSNDFSNFGGGGLNNSQSSSYSRPQSGSFRGGSANINNYSSWEPRVRTTPPPLSISSSSHTRRVSSEMLNDDRPASPYRAEYRPSILNNNNRVSDAYMRTDGGKSKDWYRGGGGYRDDAVAPPSSSSYRRSRVSSGLSVEAGPLSAGSSNREDRMSDDNCIRIQNSLQNTSSAAATKAVEEGEVSSTSDNFNTSHNMTASVDGAPNIASRFHQSHSNSHRREKGDDVELLLLQKLQQQKDDESSSADDREEDGNDDEDDEDDGDDDGDVLDEDEVERRIDLIDVEIAKFENLLQSKRNQELKAAEQAAETQNELSQAENAQDAEVEEVESSDEVEEDPFNFYFYPKSTVRGVNVSVVAHGTVEKENNSKVFVHNDNINSSNKKDDEENQNPNSSSSPTHHHQQQQSPRTISSSAASSLYLSIYEANRKLAKKNVKMLNAQQPKTNSRRHHDYTQHKKNGGNLVFTNLQNMDIFKANIISNTRVRPYVVEHIKDRRFYVARRRSMLTHKYLNLHQTWKIKTEKLEQKLEKLRLKKLKKNAGKLGSNSNMPAPQSSLPGSASSPYAPSARIAGDGIGGAGGVGAGGFGSGSGGLGGPSGGFGGGLGGPSGGFGVGLGGLGGGGNARGGRRSVFQSDAARSEAEFEDIIRQLAQQEAKPEEKDRCAKYIPMAIDPVERNLLQTMCISHLVRDPAAELAENESNMMMRWTDSEKNIFLIKLLQIGKNFPKIAESLPNKTTSDCIYYYYREKINTGVKQLSKKNVSMSGRGGKRRAGPPKRPGSKPDKEKGGGEGEEDNDAAPATARKRMRIVDTTAKRTNRNKPEKKPDDNASSADEHEGGGAGRGRAGWKTPPESAVSSAVSSVNRSINRGGGIARPAWSSSEKAEVLELFGRVGRDFDAVARLLNSNKTSEDVQEFFEANNKKLRIHEQIARFEARRHDAEAGGVEVVDEDEAGGNNNTWDNQQGLEDDETKKRRRKKKRVPDDAGDGGAGLPGPDKDSVMAVEEESGAGNDGRVGVGNNDNISNTRKTVSYWSVGEKAEFIKALKKYGRDWQRIAQMIGTKSTIQSRNYFHNFRGKLELDKVLEENGHPIEEDRPQTQDEDFSASGDLRSKTSPLSAASSKQQLYYSETDGGVADMDYMRNLPPPTYVDETSSSYAASYHEHHYQNQLHHRHLPVTTGGYASPTIAATTGDYHQSVYTTAAPHYPPTTMPPSSQYYDYSNQDQYAAGSGGGGDGGDEYYHSAPADYQQQNHHHQLQQDQHHSLTYTSVVSYPASVSTTPATATTTTTSSSEYYQQIYPPYRIPSAESSTNEGESPGYNQIPSTSAAPLSSSSTTSSIVLPAVKNLISEVDQHHHH